MRRWQPGEFDFDGVRFRIVRGKKVTKLGESGKDLRLDIKTPAGWRPVHMRLGAFLADFFGENEEILYPPFTPEGYKTPWQGGRKYLNYLRAAWQYGWEKAEGELQRERSQKDLFEEASS
jgi:hypothetical protein